MTATVPMDRRTTLKWVLAAAGVVSLVKAAAMASSDGTASASSAQISGAAHGYGTDPDLIRTYTPGELWPLTLTAAERRTATALCDVILPADEFSPSASSLGIVDFIDEWAVRKNAGARQDWAVAQLLLAARASRNLGLTRHVTFSGALMWQLVYPWPQRPVAGTSSRSSEPS